MASETIDADDLFAQAASQLMAEMGIGYETYTKDEMHQFVQATTSESGAIWDEFVLWVTCGDDKKDRTRMVLKAQMAIGNMGMRLDFVPGFGKTC